MSDEKSESNIEDTIASALSSSGGASNAVGAVSIGSASTMGVSAMEARAMFLRGIEMPSPKRVLIWFAEDPATFLMMLKLMSDVGSQETFDGVWQNVLQPVGSKLAPKLDKLFSLDEAGRVSVFSVVDEQSLVKQIVDRAKVAPQSGKFLGAQSISGIQLNPGTVLEVAEFFGSTILPILMMYLRKKR